MQKIVQAMERNDRFRVGEDGETLLRLMTIAKSNLNADLHNLDLELQRQFGLYSVEVTGDGVSLSFPSFSSPSLHLLVLCFSCNCHFR